MPFKHWPFGRSTEQTWKTTLFACYCVCAVIFLNFRCLIHTHWQLLSLKRALLCKRYTIFPYLYFPRFPFSRFSVPNASFSCMWTCLVNQLYFQEELKTSSYSVSHDLRYVLFKYDIHQVSVILRYFVVLCRWSSPYCHIPLSRIGQIIAFLRTCKTYTMWSWVTWDLCLRPFNFQSITENLKINFK